MAQFLAAQGPIARTVADVRLGLEVMSRNDVRDPWWVPAPLRGAAPAKPVKVALAKVSDWMEPDTQVMSLVRTAADYLEDAGYAVSEVEVPLIEELFEMRNSLVLTELSTLYRAEMRASGSDDFNRSIDTRIAAANILDGEGYMRAIALRTRYIRTWMQFLETFPVVLTPLSVRPIPAPRADLGTPEQVAQMWRALRFMGMFNVLGLPAATVPIGMRGKEPVGIQIVASRYREDLCLDAAEAIERRVGVLVEKLWARESH